MGFRKRMTKAVESVVGARVFHLDWRLLAVEDALGRKFNERVQQALDAVKHRLEEAVAFEARVSTRLDTTARAVIDLSAAIARLEVRASPVAASEEAMRTSEATARAVFEEARAGNLATVAAALVHALPRCWHSGGGACNQPATKRYPPHDDLTCDECTTGFKGHPCESGLGYGAELQALIRELESSGHMAPPRRCTICQPHPLLPTATQLPAPEPHVRMVGKDRGAGARRIFVKGEHYLLVNVDCPRNIVVVDAWNGSVRVRDEEGPTIEYEVAPELLLPLGAGPARAGVLASGWVDTPEGVVTVGEQRTCKSNPSRPLGYLPPQGITVRVHGLIPMLGRVVLQSAGGDQWLEDPSVVAAWPDLGGATGRSTAEAEGLGWTLPPPHRFASQLNPDGLAENQLVPSEEHYPGERRLLQRLREHARLAVEVPARAGQYRADLVGNFVAIHPGKHPGLLAAMGLSVAPGEDSSTIVWKETNASELGEWLPGEVAARWPASFRSEAEAYAFAFAAFSRGSRVRA